MPKRDDNTHDTYMHIKYMRHQSETVSNGMIESARECACVCVWQGFLAFLHAYVLRAAKIQIS